MKKICGFYFIIIVLVVACSSNKALDQSFYQKHDQEVYKMKRKYSTFIKMFEEKAENQKRREDKLEEKFDEEKSYDFENPNLEWNLNLLSDTKKEYNNLLDHIAPAVSPFGKFIASFKKGDTIRESGSQRIPYDLVLYHTNSNNSLTLFSFDDSRFQSDYIKKYNLIQWNPMGGMFALIGYQNRFVNIFLFVVEYDDLNNELYYTSFQLTDTDDEHLQYYDLQWNQDGTELAYSCTNDKDKHYVEIYDLEKDETRKLGDSKQISHFRFGIKDDDVASYIQHENNQYSAYFCDNYRKDIFKKRTLLGTFDTPYMYASFANFTHKMVLLNFETDKVNVVHYDYYDDDLLKKEETIEFSDRDLLLFEPISDPLWLYFDNVIMFTSNKEINSIYLAPNYKFVSLLKGSHINSLTKDLHDRLYYSHLYGRNYQMLSILQNLSSRDKGREVEENWYSIRFKEIKNDNLAKIKRSRRPIPSAPIAADQLGEIQFYPENDEFDAKLTVNKNIKLQDIKRKTEYYVKCPEQIKGTMWVAIEFKVGSYQTDIQKD